MPITQVSLEKLGAAKLNTAKYLDFLLTEPIFVEPKNNSLLIRFSNLSFLK